MAQHKEAIKKILALLCASIFLLFSNGRWFFALAAWMYPMFMLYFSRKMKPLTGYLTVAAVSAVCCQISFWKFTSMDPSKPLFYIPAFLGLMLALPFLADRLLYQKRNGVLSTLVFPLAYTSMDYIYASFSPFGSTGVLGYTQYGFLPLIQVVSITGIWGLTFLVTWFGSVVNRMLEGKTDITVIKKTAALYSIVLASVLLYGSLRLIIPSDSGTINVSGIHVYDKLGTEGAALKLAVGSDWDKYRQMCAGISDRLFDATVKQARAGAQIIVWSELSPQIAHEDEAAFIRRALSVADQEGIYLIATPYVRYKNGKAKDENKLLIFSPTGQVALTHYKFGGNLLEGSLKGDQILRYADTPFGRISGVICWDQDYPAINTQAGRKKVDVVFAPAADWKEIDPIHSVVGYFRAIENGYSLVRQCMNGLSIICDPKGRILTTMDHYTVSDWVMSAQVPTKHCFTIYPYIGDLFAWLSLAGLLFLITCRIFKFGAYKSQSPGSAPL